MSCSKENAENMIYDSPAQADGISQDKTQSCHPQESPLCGATPTAPVETAPVEGATSEATAMAGGSPIGVAGLKLVPRVLNQADTTPPTKPWRQPPAPRQKVVGCVPGGT